MPCPLSDKMSHPLSDINAPPLSHKYPIPISQLCLVNTDVPAGVDAPPLDTTTNAVSMVPSIA